MRACLSLARTPMSVDKRLREPLGGLIGIIRSGVPIPANLILDSAVGHTVSYDAVNDVFHARRCSLCVRVGRGGRRDSIILSRQGMIPRPEWHLRNAVDANAIFHVVLLNENCGIRSGAHAKRALRPRQKLDRELVRSGRNLRTRASLDACQPVGRAIDVDKIASPDDRTKAHFLVKIALIPLLRCG